MKKYEKMILPIIVAATSLFALYFIVKQKMDAAILTMTIMFIFTNLFRARSFKEKGHEKEAKWMKTMAIIFAILSVMVLGIIIVG